MPATPSTRRWSSALIGLTLAVAIGACTSAEAAGSPSPAPSSPSSPVPSMPVLPAPDSPAPSDPVTPAPTEAPPMPTPKPSADPTPAPATPVPATPRPTPAPTDGGGDAIPITVDLETVNDADVTIDIVDRTGGLVDAHSGTPEDGASVPPYQIRIDHIDPQTIRLTWVDYPHDNRLGMWIDEVDGELRILIVQPEPTGPTDSIALDRVLELTFDRVIDEVDIEAILQDGLDTPA